MFFIQGGLGFLFRKETVVNGNILRMTGIKSDAVCSRIENKIGMTAAAKIKDGIVIAS